MRRREGQAAAAKLPAPGENLLAIQAGVTVIPVTIRGSREVLPKGSLRIRPGIITVSVGEPIDPRRFPLAEKEALMERVRAATERLAPASNPRAPGGSDEVTPLGQYQVPRPDLSRFNQLLSQGGSEDVR